VFFFQMLYPFAWVNAARRRCAAVAGGCMLVHRATLRAAGGLAAIRGALIDDCALARLVKPHGPIRIALTDRVRSIRAYPSFRPLRRMIARTAFTQLECSIWRLAATAVAMIVVFVAPPILTLWPAPAEPIARALAALAWIAMTLAFVPILRFYRLSPAWAPALPAIAAAYLALTIDSAFQHLAGRGGEWKGRMSAPGRPKRESAPKHGVRRVVPSAPGRPKRESAPKTPDGARIIVSKPH
jgi:hopene-associated glycosyltransferase HpnB